ncbi:MAG: hypothetical protein ACYTG6_04865, partial [Planctomycetota bacterium]
MHIVRNPFALSLFLVSLALLPACGGGGGGGFVPPPPPGPQLASLSVDLGTNTLSIVQPANLTLSGTAVYDDVADTVTIDLTILNSGFPRLIFNLKALVTALAEGTVTGDGTFSG